MRHRRKGFYRGELGKFPHFLRRSFRDFHFLKRSFLQNPKIPELPHPQGGVVLYYYEDPRPSPPRFEIPYGTRFHTSLFFRRPVHFEVISLKSVCLFRLGFLYTCMYACDVNELCFVLSGWNNTFNIGKNAIRWGIFTLQQRNVNLTIEGDEGTCVY